MQITRRRQKACLRAVICCQNDFIFLFIKDVNLSETIKLKHRNVKEPRV